MRKINENKDKETYVMVIKLKLYKYYIKYEEQERSNFYSAK